MACGLTKRIETKIRETEARSFPYSKIFHTYIIIQPLLLSTALFSLAKLVFIARLIFCKLCTMIWEWFRTLSFNESNLDFKSTICFCSLRISLGDSLVFLLLFLPEAGIRESKGKSIYFNIFKIWNYGK